MKLHIFALLLATFVSACVAPIEYGNKLLNKGAYAQLYYYVAIVGDPNANRRVIVESIKTQSGGATSNAFFESAKQLLIASKPNEDYVVRFDRFVNEARADKLLNDSQIQELKAVLATIDDSKERLLEARESARFTCKDKLECEKAFSLTQIYISEKSTMKIQTANDTIIETFNPTESTAIGMKAVKMPLKGNTAQIILTVVCKDVAAYRELCIPRMTQFYSAYPAFINSSLNQ